MKVCIDAGHYTGYNAGAVPGYYEGNAMWILAGFLQSALEKYGIEVINTRQSMDKDLSLDLRGRTAADNGADLFLSLHSNAASVNARGTEIYYSIHRTESKKLADALGMAIVNLMKQDLPNTVYRGSKTRKYSVWTNKDYYGVIRGAVGDNGSNPVKHALLIEHGFHTNPDECRWLSLFDNLKRLAAVEADVIAEYFGLKFEPRTFEENVVSSQLSGKIGELEKEIAGLKEKLSKIKELAG